MSKSVTLRLNDDLYQLISTLAGNENRTLSNFIETAVLRQIEQTQFADEFERKRKIRSDIPDNPLLSIIGIGASEPPHDLAEKHNLETQKCNIYDLKGIGKEIWKETDAQEYVNQERDSWKEAIERL